MKKPSKSAIVFTMIKEKITKGELVNGDRLSSARVLAKEFNVSYVTMIKALDLLEHENLITRILKTGIFIGTKIKNEPISCKKIPVKTKAEEIADSVISEIIHGNMKAGEHLTLNKILMFKYGTTKITIKKAIEILLDRKYIHKDGFRYRIGQPTGSIFRTGKNHVYILTKQESIDWYISHFVDRSFFHELQKYGVTSFEFLNLWNEPDLINKIEVASTAGFLMDFRHLSVGTNEPEKLLTRFKKTVEVIGKKHLPLVVDNYNRVLRLIPDFTFKPVPNLFYIGHDDFEAGEKVGAYLASMGHKQIAYFNFGNSPWDLERFKGVESALKRLFNNESDLYYFHDNSGAKFTADLSTYASTPEKKRKRFLEAYSQLFDDYQFDSCQFQESDPVKKTYPVLADIILQDMYKKRMTPVFKKVMKIKKITAWVGTGINDTIAAAQFLMDQKISIPDKISLIGFRDNENTAKYGITAYDFMDSKAGYLAAHCILGDIPIQKNRKGYVEYEGQIIVRKSVKAI
jgi:DNA-binding transcriptional regulator YhcF (GntR family)